MLQSIFSDVIQLLLAISSLYFAIGFVLSVASKVTLKVQIVEAQKLTHPSASISPPAHAASSLVSPLPLHQPQSIAYNFTATESALAQIITLNQVASLSQQLLPSIAPSAADAQLDAHLYCLLHLDQIPAVLLINAAPQRKANAPKAVKAKKSRAAAKTLKSHSTSVPTVAASTALQINLSQCRTGQLRGHTYVDINHLPNPLPPGVKAYSVRGKFQGVKVDDLEQHGFLVIR